MYGINLVEVAKILGMAVGSNALFSRSGIVHSIYQEIVEYAAREDIEMVKVMMRTLAQQNEQAYEDVAKILKEYFTEQELREILR